jgi:hypothetical protein
MFALASIGFVVLVAIVAIVVASGKRRRAGRRRGEHADDPTGYTPGVWLLGGADSAKPGHHHGADHGHGGHGGHDGGNGGGGDGGSGGGAN